MKPKFSNAIACGLGIAVLTYSVGIGIKNYFRYNRFKLEHKTRHAELAEKVQLQQRFKRQLVRLENPDYWELVIKRRLGYAKKGEIVYRTISD